MIAPEDDSLYSLVMDIAYWASVATVGLLTFVSAVGIAGYAWHTWG